MAKNSSRFITFMNPYYRSLVKFRKDGNAGSIVSYRSLNFCISYFLFLSSILLIKFTYYMINNYR